ncbi:MAG TPA: hypothetical protein VHS05_12525 [Pyrinomonadaceae bacterium]|nr:hypothetical protein [Pyrinomonadaceae bacterium]
MTLRSFLKATLVAVILLTAATASAQAPAAKPTPTPVDVVYTGRLFGYFRVPSLQQFSQTSGCPNYNADLASKAAKQFIEVRDQQDLNKTILVGTGDNFAPELEARVFDGLTSTATKYKAGNKELYLGSSNQWLDYDDPSKAAEKLRNDIAAGFGVIPNDNVACFLRRAKYAAIVPGKHDFYFGAERVREFARFLAAPANGDYEPVQMLGANLVMKTEPIEDTSVSTKVKNDRDFGDWPTDYPVLNLKDGKTVYPWFSIVKIQLAEIPSEATFSKDLSQALQNLMGTAGVDLKTNLKKVTDAIDDASGIVEKKLEDLQNKKAAPDEISAKTADKNRLVALKNNLVAAVGSSFDLIRICSANVRPNDLQKDLKDCDPTLDPKLRVDGNKIVLDVYLRHRFQGRNGHFSTLPFGKNFGLCTSVPVTKDNPTGKGCIRFSSHTPFFYFPHEVAYDNANGYTDPEPYVVKDNQIAIFGVVEPTLGEQVGQLNFGWKQKDHPELTTRLSAEDPAEALQQQLDYFNVQHPDFPGVKVLLAQMTPQHARALAGRFPEFQIVVSGGDRELATSNLSLSTTWKPQSNAAGAFLAVPTPYFNPSTREGSVHFGIIKATPNNTEWKLSADARAGDPVHEREDPALNFWAKIKALPGGCLPDGFQPDPNVTYDNKTYLKWLVLCSMQQYLGADVALIQTQDLFDQVLELEHRINRAQISNKDAGRDENIQQTLDRLIWKGDLITLMYVPGKALKKALDQSDKFGAEENSTLSLSVDRGRTLETLGVRSDKGEYFVNGLPIADDRIYAVATTDYIGAGDTGYPDLKNAARNPRPYPAAFTGELVPISSLVCRKLFPTNFNLYCLEPIKSDSYLDETMAKQIPPYPDEGQFSKMWAATGLALPGERTDSKDPAAGLENRVQRRSFWGFSLKNFSIGFKDVDNNRTDDSIKEKFAGVSTSGVTSTASRTISVGLDTRLSYFADHYELFLGSGVDYERQSQGDPVVATGISLNKNRLFGETGMVWWRHPGRELPNIGAVFSVHGETQIEQPFSAFNLNTDEAEQIRITQKRGALVLGRVGFRWENRTNTLELGVQAGKELRGLRGYHFENPDDNDIDCLVNSAQTLSKCIEVNSKPPAGLITPNSIPSALLQSRPRAGIYWSHSLSFPLGSKLKYEVTQDADFFFVKFDRDTTIDTRFRYNSKNRLSFMIWPNFSIGPTLDLFMYQNKVNRNFLFQRTLGIETKLFFDIFNRREKKAQVIARE